MSKIDLRQLLSTSLVANANEPVAVANTNTPAEPKLANPRDGQARLGNQAGGPPHPSKGGAQRVSAPRPGPVGVHRALRPRRRT